LSFGAITASSMESRDQAPNYPFLTFMAGAEGLAELG
jgi:hypothetical protein